ncbi:cAMP-binding domain of CRP or a regulatory subunit of cAMP-dependent protein kinases [Chryseolinea serpens]|uniref:cAMP-binding domain of CRP or a regulatory subunit of cAMP-dependent protein kinases n=1 Tax=Chryseolinea serpens TaxID=947013 RepID=A0A1M5KQR6_9BACT|nr:Crp/Fnr family transcriptional regulator [Chryseolinea serpens]SHG55108.1 cAMP-binding domain of CRP or a regulatory subunit of cAMP-dependent protein kinases [Chryseolinea serpens]
MEHTPQLNSLIQHIRKFVPLTDADTKTVSTFIQPKTIPNKTILSRAGEICHEKYFVAKGCLRLFIHTDEGNEQIIQFAIDNWWMTDYMSFELQRPSTFTIQAVEPSQLLVITKTDLEELLAKVPTLERYFRLIAERAYSASLTRIHFIYNQSGEERYGQFCRLFPEFVQRVPQYMLASYLGFTPEFLSKIRAKRKE